MTLIISEDGQNAQRIAASGFDKEDYLQNYIYNNPEAIPVYEIDEDIHLLVLAREFGTGSGPIDALGIDQNGNIYLIETKLYKNPDKRLVVAQVLDYGASLWSSSIDFADFSMKLDQHVHRQFNVGMQEKIKDFFSLDDEAVESLLFSMQTNLNSGTFKFVVLMDSLHRQLKDLIIFLNRNSQFDVYAIELEYYKHQTFEIIIPRIFGTEVKKDMVVTKSSVGGRRTWDEASYFQDVRSKLGDKKVAAIRNLYDWAKANAGQIRWGTGLSRGSFNPVFENISSRSFISVFSDGAVQISYGYLPNDIEIRKKLRTILQSRIDVPGVTDVSDGGLRTSFKSIPSEYVADHVDEIVESLTEFINS